MTGRRVHTARSGFAVGDFFSASLTSSSVSASASPPSVTCSPTISSDVRSSHACRASSRSSLSRKACQHLWRRLTQIDRTSPPLRPDHSQRCKPRRRVRKRSIQNQDALRYRDSRAASTASWSKSARTLCVPRVPDRSTPDRFAAETSRRPMGSCAGDIQPASASAVWSLIHQ